MVGEAIRCAKEPSGRTGNAWQKDYPGTEQSKFPQGKGSRASIKD
jgi:hypothetical protein